MIWLLICLLVVPFGLVLLAGAPYLPTRRRQVSDALDLLHLKTGDTIVDLGCGDGVVLLAAAKRGIKAVGYELNPLIYCVAYLRTFRYRKLVTIYCRDFWQQTLPTETKGVFVFLLDSYMSKLNTKLTKELPSGAKVLSYAFEITEKKPVQKKGALYLYQY